MLDELKDKAASTLDSAKEALKNVADDPRAKEAVEKAKDKAKDMIDDAKDKAEDFVREKTDGKGIFGFGKK